MFRFANLLIIAVFGITAFAAVDASAFKKSRFAREDDCTKCHKLDVAEASSIIKNLNPSIEVLEVNMGPVEGLWEVVISARGKKGLAYVDFTKEHVITGSILKVSTKENLSSLRLYDLSKIDLTDFPLDEAIVMGKPDAPYKVIVFDDPD